MKAIVREKYGAANELILGEIDKPVPKENELLIKVHAVSLNASDVENMTGTPFYIRAWGLFSPKYKILGSDIAGVIEAVGAKVTTFKVGDAVYGDALYNWGGFAEYVCTPEKMMKLKPASLSFETAATLPQAAVVAYQGLRYKRKIVHAEKVLINGAGGGSGSFAIQMAKQFDVEVTGVDSSDKLNLMRSLGADYVIDYKLVDFTKNGIKYDFILDLVASHSISDYKNALAKNGVYAMVGGHMKHIFDTLIFGAFISFTGTKKIGMFGAKPNENLDEIVQLIDSGKIKPIIDKHYTLSEVPLAMQYLADGDAKGKIIITF